MNKLYFTDPDLLNEISKTSRVKTIEKGEVLLSPGNDMVFVPLVQKGVLRIVRADSDGREIFLYHLYPGETCAMSINCCQTGRKSMIKAIAEDDTEVLLIPVTSIESWFKYPEWKAFINNTYSTRFAELLNVIDLIAFSNMDMQVLHYLQERAKAAKTKILNITHQQVADEMHTHREAISRLLRTMEQKNMVRLGRNTIELISL
jgi:cAMP-binding proteins - catabolite gene activator and regulatory subunit of cAMP-dependent protein kinases